MHWAQHRVKAHVLGPLYYRAFVTVDQKANLTLLFERADATFARVTVPLMQQPNVLLTHAAFAPTLEGRLLVAVHSCQGIISAYWVDLDLSEARQKLDAKPTIMIELAATNLSASTSTVLNNEIYDPASYTLTHLGIIPTSDLEGAERPPPTVYGVYANCSRNLAATDPGFLVAGVIRQWTISSVVQELHPRFNELPVKTSDTSLKMTASIQRCADKDEQIITSVTHLDNRQGIFITTHDGRSEFLRIDDLSHDLSSLAYEASSIESSFLTQSGFTFPMNTQPAHTALSPTTSLLATVSPISTLSLLTMDFAANTDGQSLDPTSPQSEVAIAAIILTFSRACWTSSSFEDLLSLALHNFPPSFTTPLITNLYHTLFREGEFVSETLKSLSDVEKVVQKPVLAKVFSFHYSISFLSIKDEPAGAPPPLSSQWVWISSNLRFVAQVLYMHVRDLQTSSPNITQEIVSLMCNNIKWTLDLFRYMIAHILEVGDRDTNPDFFPPPRAGERGDGRQGLVALLINCHWSRQIFLTIMKALKALYKTPEPRSKFAAQVIRAIQQGTVGKGFTIPVMDAMLQPQWVAQGDRDEKDVAVLARRQIEMMATGVVPQEYQGTLRRLLDNLFNRSGGIRDKGQVDRLKLWTERVDLGWIMMENPGVGRVWDVHKKTIVSSGVVENGGNGEAMIKTCVRCGKHGEDVNGFSGPHGKILAAALLRCVCDGAFVLERWEDAVE
jgi:Mediator complex subunit 16